MADLLSLITEAEADRPRAIDSVVRTLTGDA